MYTCNYFKDIHCIYSCENFVGIDRIQVVKKNSSICPKCLRTGHSVYNCKIGPCKKCKARRNSLLHIEGAKTEFLNYKFGQNGSRAKIHGNVNSRRFNPGQ